MMKSLNHNTKAGFTLIEIMLVIIIVVGLMAVLIPNLITSRDNAKIAQAEMYITRLAGHIALYEMTSGFPPSTVQGLRALVEKPQGEPSPRKWSQREDRIEPDPWGMEYRYEFPGRRNKKGADIYSCGPDRQPDTADDIGNWDSK